MFKSLTTLRGVTFGEDELAPGLDVGSGSADGGGAELLLDDVRFPCFNFAKKRCGLEVSLELRRRSTFA